MSSTNEGLSLYCHSSHTFMVGRQFQLKCYMLLNLALQVGWVMVVLITGNLLFLAQPCLHLIHVTQELLQLV